MIVDPFAAGILTVVGDLNQASEMFEARHFTAVGFGSSRAAECCQTMSSTDWFSTILITMTASHRIGPGEEPHEARSKK